MDDPDEVAAHRRAAALRDEAERTRRIATALDEVVAEVTGRLDAVRERIGPPAWRGRGASVAASAAEHATEDLALAARSLGEVAEELRLAAGMLEWRAATPGSPTWWPPVGEPAP